MSVTIFQIDRFFSTAHTPDLVITPVQVIAALTKLLVDALNLLDWAATLADYPKMMKRIEETGGTMPPGHQGTPTELARHKNILKLIDFDISDEYLRNRRKDYDAPISESFDVFCILNWEENYNRKYNPKKFPGWYLHDIARWKQQYVQKYIDEDLDWVEFGKKNCEQEKLKFEAELEKVKDARAGIGNLADLLKAILAKASNWKNHEKMESTIVATVVDDRTSGDVPGVSVGLSPTAGNAGGAGSSFEFEPVTDGNYVLEARAQSYVTQSSQVIVAGCNTYALTIRLKRLPRIRITGIINNDTNAPVTDPIAVRIIDQNSKAQIATGTSAGRVVEFSVDPGSYEIRADDPTNKWELIDSVYLNLDPGDVRDIQLRVRPKTGVNIFLELMDDRSQQKIDPPAGHSPVPEVKLEPLDRQPKPSGANYQGGGDVLFGRVHAGLYRYKANICGWNYKEGTLAITQDDLKAARISKQIFLKPTSIDHYPIKVREHGGKTSNVHGFKVSVTGLGPRIGENVSVVIGEDPQQVGYVPDFASFRIRGSFYSGRYKIKITHACYQPYEQDPWLTFCGGDSMVFKRQTRYLDPKPELVEARLDADKAIKLTRKVRSLANSLQRELDRLKAKFGKLKADIANFESKYVGERLSKEQLEKAKEEHAELERRLARYEDLVGEFESTLTEYKEKKKEREKLLQKIQSSGNVFNCLKDNMLLKDDLHLLSEAAAAFPEDSAASLKPSPSLPALPTNALEVERCEAMLEKVRGMIPNELVAARTLLNAEKAECLGLTSAIDQSIEDLSKEIEKLINEQFGLFQLLILACQFKEAKESIEQMPSGTTRSQAEDEYRKAAQRENKAKLALDRGEAKAKECKHDDALAKMAEAKGISKCDEFLEKLEQRAAEVKAASEYEKHTKELFREANGKYKTCDYDEALGKLTEARNHTRCERYREQLTKKVAIVEKAISHEKRTKSLYKASQEDFKNCDLSQALDKLNRALSNTKCNKYRDKIKQRISLIEKSKPDVDRVKSIFKDAKADYAKCDYDDAVVKLNEALGFAPCGRYRDSLAEKIEKTKAAKVHEQQTKAIYAEARGSYKSCNYSEALSKLNQALNHTRCKRHKKTLSEKVAKTKATKGDNDRAKSLIKQAQGFRSRGNPKEAMRKLELARNKAKCRAIRQQIESEMSSLQTGIAFIDPVEPPKPPKEEEPIEIEPPMEEPELPPVEPLSGNLEGNFRAKWWFTCDFGTTGRQTGKLTLDIKKDGSYSGNMFYDQIFMGRDLSGKFSSAGQLYIKGYDDPSDKRTFWELKGKYRPAPLAGHFKGNGDFYREVVIAEVGSGKILREYKCRGKWSTD